MVCARECVFTQPVCAARTRLAPRKRTRECWNTGFIQTGQTAFLCLCSTRTHVQTDTGETQNNARKVKKKKKMQVHTNKFASFVPVIGLIFKEWKRNPSKCFCLLLWQSRRVCQRQRQLPGSSLWKDRKDRPCSSWLCFVSLQLLLKPPQHHVWTAHAETLLSFLNQQDIYPETWGQGRDKNMLT